MKIYLLLAVLIISQLSLSQRGKNGNYTTSSMNEVLNSYTYLSNDANIGNTTISVQSSAMTNSFFGSNLEAGDLIFIHQMQGASMNIDITPTVSWGGDYTIPWDDVQWGDISNYLNAGNHEFIEVASVSGNTITLQCALQNNYTASGKVVVIRVPRLEDLTVASNTSITALDWNGQIGGEVILEVNGIIDIQSNGSIDASGKGFRGAAYDNASGSNLYGNGEWATSTPNKSARKGEGIGGYETEYNALYSEWGMGAPANGGGGGNGHNSGGGGGANAGLGNFTGQGNPDPNASYTSAWNQESAGFAGSTSTGGGRGGYSSSETNSNPATLAPGDAGWASDNRRVVGGIGGHVLDYSTGKIFAGGGGGAGHGNDSEGGAGGAGGGIIYILAYGDFNGSGEIITNGENGEHSEGPTPFGTDLSGDDGAGGAGAGGTVMINSINAISNSISISANGGVGGDTRTQYGSPFDFFGNGPGGGGSGGYIAISSGSPTLNVDGGANGITWSRPFDTEFPPNGATAGGDGISSGSLTPWDILVENDTFCAGGVTINLNDLVTTVGTLPSSVQFYTSEFGGTPIANPTSYSISNTTTFYAGLCPGTFRNEFTVLISPAITISGTATITNTSCNGSTGSITGLTASGGSGVLVLDWNGVTSASEDLTNAAPNSYTLTVTDENGCTATSGPHTISSISGPSIDSTSYVLTPESCSGGDGSITGITSTGNAPLTYEWNTTSYPSEEITDASTGVYWLYVTDGNNCTDSTGPYTMTQVQGPIIDSINYSLTNSACNNPTGTITGITATGTGVLTYEWNGVSFPSADASGLQIGSYTLVVTDGNGCQDSTYGYVIGQLNPPVLDTLNYAVTNTSCDQNNGSISGITTTGNGPFDFEWNGISSSDEDVNGLGVGVYSLVVTDANGCVDSTYGYAVMMHTPPIIDSLNYLIEEKGCVNDDGNISGITVSGNGPFEYYWNGNLEGSIDHSNLGVGSYELVVIDANGCSDTTGIYEVTQVDDPVLDSTNMQVQNSDCTNNTGEISGITVTGEAPFVYSWDGVVSANIDITGLAPGLHDLIVIDANGCDDTITGINIGTLNGPIIDGTQLLVESDHCGQGIGGISGITISGGTPGYTYLWDNNGGTSLDVSGLDSNSYQLTVTDAAGCVAFFGPVDVGNTQGPSINQNSVNVMDDFCDLGNGYITGIAVSGDGPFTYSWSNGDSTIAIIGLEEGNYLLTVTDAHGCSAVSSLINVGNANPNPIDFTWSPNPVLVSDPNVIFTGMVNGNYSSVDWNFGIFGSDTGVIVPTIMDQVGVYPVTFTVEFSPGCIDSIQYDVLVKGTLTVPNVVTTNGDGINDFFVVDGLLPNTKVSIFNRWGNLVFESDNYNNQWNGFDKEGTRVTDGEYFYVIIDPSNETYQGSVRIISQ